MRSRLRFWKYPLSIILLLLVIAVFTLVYALSETAKAPYERGDKPDAVVMDAAEHETDIEEADEPEDEPEEEPEIDPADLMGFNPNVDGFVTIQMQEAEINRGPLILVNHDHKFEIPDDIDLVNVLEARETEFRVQSDTTQLLSSIMQPLDEMMEAFISSTGNRAVTIRSGFRTYNSQQRILDTYTSRMGRTAALRWASLPGHSEHHTGLAFDFGIMTGNTLGIFSDTGSTSWFRRNSHRFGFIVRYQQHKTQITRTNNEPWHFRYVGLPHSIIMVQNDWCLEEYIEIIREYTFEEPFEIEIDEILYEIYFTASTDVKLPFHSEFEISGNNIDGFIVTVNRLEFDPDEGTEIEI